MRKMMTPTLEIVRFENEDVIAASTLQAHFMSHHHYATLAENVRSMGYMDESDKNTWYTWVGNDIANGKSEPAHYFTTGNNASAFTYASASSGVLTGTHKMLTDIVAGYTGTNENPYKDKAFWRNQ